MGHAAARSNWPSRFRRNRRSGSRRARSRACSYAALAGVCTHEAMYAVARPAKGFVLRRFGTFVDLASACTYEVAVASAVVNVTVRSSACDPSVFEIFCPCNFRCRDHPQV